MFKILLFIILLYAFACLFLYVKQRNILYFPTRENSTADAESFFLQSGQQQLKIWVLNEGDDAIIYFGGNSEAVEENIADFRHLFSHFTVYIVNYRGYGGSTGTPSEKALFEDALTVYDQLKKKHRSINVIGRSLGSGVACYLASRRTVDRLVLTTPYDSIRQVAQTHYPLFPVKWLIRDHFDSMVYAPDINSKTLVLYAGNDKVVPLQHTLNLLSNLPGARAEMIAGSAHNDIATNTDYLQQLADFFNEN